MPLYLCQSGAGQSEPWKHSMTVHSKPHAHPLQSSPLRRIRHAEVVLVDDICLAHGWYWLRLQWPGHKGGFAGYVAVQPLPVRTTTTTNKRVGSTKKKGTVASSSLSEETGPEPSLEEAKTYEGDGTSLLCVCMCVFEMERVFLFVSGRNPLF